MSQTAIETLFKMTRHIIGNTCQLLATYDDGLQNAILACFLLANIFLLWYIRRACARDHNLADRSDQSSMYPPGMRIDLVIKR